MKGHLSHRQSLFRKLFGVVSLTRCKDIEDLELQRAELSKNARICSILHDLIDKEVEKEEKIKKAQSKQPTMEW